MLNYIVAGLFFVGVLLSTLFLVMVFLQLCLAHYRIKPCIVAVTAAIMTGALLEFSGYLLAFHLRWIFLPLISAALVTAVSLTKGEWKLMAATPALHQMPASRWRDIVMVVGGLAGAAVGVATGAGKAILLSLGYDVLGNTAEELREVYAAGALTGFLVGAFLSLFFWVIGVRFFRKL
ncbi:hypothetical protein [Gimesia fumaroli]|uniref:Uncharacterized protein n=1 Tax=Gimesia fumaroli TaxID=2527976 RepID=A0A518I4K2_9PLAN|nr:hypothetical protein [Gimesia fumaroli]QDV48041.1 hypothetical protein Enr17x_00500 [Gimesia fumaroli]